MDVVGCHIHWQAFKKLGEAASVLTDADKRPGKILGSEVMKFDQHIDLLNWEVR